MGDLWQDLRYGLRMLARNPGFTAVAVVTLALGIGVNTAVFSVLNAAAFRPLPVKNPSDIVRVSRWVQQGYGGTLFSYPEYSYYRGHNSVFSGLLADACCYDILPGDLPAPIGPARSDATEVSRPLQGELVSSNYFSELGVDAALGRAFLLEEGRTAGADPVVVLGYRYWQRQFASDPSIVGKTMTLNGTRFTVVGVSPRGFIGTGDPPRLPDVWIPLTMQAEVAPGSDWLDQPSEYRLRLAGRLKPGVTRKRAEAELTVLGRDLARESSGELKTIALRLKPATYFDLGDTGAQFAAIVGLVLVAVIMVLLIACANVANLLLARAAARQREIAVRLALGASRARLVRQLLTESILLGLMGGALGLLASFWTCHLVWLIVQQSIERFSGVAFILNLEPDMRVFGYTFLISLSAACVFGLAPALQATRPDLAAGLKKEGAAPIAWLGRKTARVSPRDLLIVAQVSVSLVLLIGAGLLGRGFLRSQTVDPGFETRRVLGFDVQLQLLRRGQAATTQLPREILERLQALPEVASAGMAQNAPGGGGHTPVTFERSHAVLQDDSAFNLVSPTYFQTLGVSIVRGRTFTQEETARGAQVVVISQDTARRFWPGEDAIGKQLRTDLSAPWVDARLRGRTFQVVGVAKDVRNENLSRTDRAYLYFALPPDPSFILFVRTKGLPRAALPDVRDALGSVDKNLRLAPVYFMEDALWFGRLPSMVGAMVASALGFLAVLLALAGIYGVVAYAVSLRTREIGIRMALGAQRLDVFKLVLRRACSLVALGVVLGLAGSIPAAHVLAAAIAGDAGSPDLLFGLSALDPVTFGGVSALLVAAALLASYIPGRRATKVDPVVALRYE